ncbi:MAG: hypothetical protein AB1432_05295 [Bacteroidota bacterium]
MFTQLNNYDVRINNHSMYNNIIIKPFDIHINSSIFFEPIQYYKLLFKLSMKIESMVIEKLLNVLTAVVNEF